MWYINCVQVNTKKICDHVHDVYSERNAKKIEQTTYLKKYKIEVG
jgi:hypothetical protein